MPTYTLTISLTEAQVATLHAAGDSIMLAKPSSAGGPPDVAWLALPPQQNTTVTWADEYGLYFSTQAFAAGAGIIAAAAISAVAAVAPPIASQVLYTLDATGSFTGPDTSRGTAGAFALLSQYQSRPGMVGLTQCATVNGTPAGAGPLPVLADAVLAGQTDTIAPSPGAYIWTQSAGGLGSLALPGSLMLVVMGGQTYLPFGPDNLTIRVEYDTNNSTFIIKLA